MLKCSLGLLEGVYPDLLCAESVGTFSALLAPSLLSTRWCWFFHLVLELLAVSNGSCLESLEREFILSEQTSYSVLFIRVPSEQISKQEFPNNAFAQHVKPILCCVGRIQYWIEYISACLLGWLEGDANDAYVGHSLKSWAQWSLWVPSNSEDSVIFYIEHTLCSHNAQLLSQMPKSTVWKHSSSNLSIWILFWS